MSRSLPLHGRQRSLKGFANRQRAIASETRQAADTGDVSIGQVGWIGGGGAPQGGRRVLDNSRRKMEEMRGERLNASAPGPGLDMEGG